MSHKLGLGDDVLMFDFALLIVFPWYALSLKEVGLVEVCRNILLRFKDGATIRLTKYIKIFKNNACRRRTICC